LVSAAAHIKVNTVPWNILGKVISIPNAAASDPGKVNTILGV
jgi:hypothetical protein